jgi:uncharacterized membrane protein
VDAPPSQRPSRYQIGALVVLMLMTACFELALINERPLWFDEVFSVNNARENSYTSLLLWKSYDNKQPPLSFLILKASLDLLQSSAPWVVRLAPCVAGIACIPMMFLLGKSLHSPALGLWCAALTAVNPVLVDQSTQARMFSMLCLGTILSAHLLVRWVRNGTLEIYESVILGATLGISLWNNQLILVSWCAAATSALLVSVSPTRQRADSSILESSRWRVGLAVAVACLTGLPGILDLTKRIGVGAGSGVDSWAIYHEFRRELLELLPTASITWHWRLDSLLPMATCALPLIGVGWLWKRSGMMVLPVLFLGVYGLVFAVLLRQRHPFFAVRYLMPMLPFLWVGLSAFAVLPGNRWLKAGASLLLLAIVVREGYLCTTVLMDWKGNNDFEESWRIGNLRSRVDPDDQVVFIPRYAELFGNYYSLPVNYDLELQLDERATDGSAALPLIRVDTSRTTWVIASRMYNMQNVASAKRNLLAIAGAYGLAVDREHLDRHFKKNVVGVARISREGIRYVPADQLE